MDEAELKRLEGLCAKASTGPWEAGDFDCVGPGDGPKEELLMANLYRGKADRVYLNASCVTGSCSLFNDADFIAAARTALPAALAEVRRLNALVAMNAALLDASATTAALGDEVVRLRGLVKAAERVESSTASGVEMVCPHCGESGKHKPDCPAFTPDGSVR